MTAAYTAVATANGRDGRAVTTDGRLDVELAFPEELGGTGKGTNPEQLFAAGYAACFASVLKLLAGGRSIPASAVADVSITAEVGLHGPDGESRFSLSARLRAEFPDEIGPELGRELLAATHEACPYSSATRGNIPVELIVE
ncbi:Ohr family peroxiredoxin [Nocardia aurantia]|uniref:Organic hydroperoxide resistance protein OhrB n=1 Tax=Nocardia aurantia TaxID=2585199 RepID=A0A7K0DRK2_9NOCA|nr:Ohr family peroxiredoxin [Nocardia aurantia]MQY28361.1 Organic hydroperoxide resistance protein OhrB [Nocardia aurantia]